MRKPYKVVGVYHPPEGATPEDIGTNLKRIVAKAGYRALEETGWSGATWYDKTSAEVRTEPTGKTVSNWHFDCTDALDRYIVVWANKDPTQIRYKHGRKIYQPESFEVVVFDNSRMLHRRNSSDQKGRLFFRQYVEPTEIP